MSDKLEDQLQAEYLLLQQSYEDFDRRALTIKSWGATLLGGGIIYGVAQDSVEALIATTIGSIILLAIESIWKAFQYCCNPRIQEIELWFREGKNGHIVPFQIFTSWVTAWRKQFKVMKEIDGKQELDYVTSMKGYWRVVRHPFVFLPYLPIVILAMLCIVWVSMV